MGITVSGLDSVVSQIEKQSEKYIQAFIDDLDYIGLKVIRYIRDRSGEESWIDQTGNLRSSIGYVIVRNGKIVKRGGFEKVDGPKRSETTEDGSVLGENYAKRLAADYTKGFALIVVAGMDYASYVEDMESKDVLKGGELEAEKLVKKLIDDYNRMSSND